MLNIFLIKEEMKVKIKEAKPSPFLSYLALACTLKLFPLSEILPANVKIKEERNRLMESKGTREKIYVDKNK